ncbi:TPA: tail fiber assembly protein, partial [Providencia alcalifaciens]
FFDEKQTFVFIEGKVLPYETPKETLVAKAENTLRLLLNEATIKIDSLQDAVDLDIATDAEIVSLKEWKKYRVLLNRVDTSTAPDVTFPEKPE